MSNKNKIYIAVICVLCVCLAVLVAKLFPSKVEVETSGNNREKTVSAAEESDRSEEIASSEETSEASEEISTEPSEEISAEVSSGESEEPSEESSDESSAEESSEESSAQTADDGKEKPNYIKKDENKKYIAFTFDDGPSPRTMELLDFLEENGMKATFFVVGNRLDGTAARYSAEVKRAVSIGCEIGIHAYTHEYYWHSCSDSVYNDELNKTRDLIYENAGYYPIIMRPPGGSISEERADKSEYNIIIWNVDSEDWKNSSRSDDATIKQNIETIVNNIMDNAKDGSIVLMHDLYTNSVEAFKIASLRLKEQGYEFVTVAEIADLDGDTTIGKRYYSEYTIK